MTRGKVREFTSFVVEGYLQLSLHQSQVEPCASKDELAQPIDEVLTVQRQHIFPSLKEILSQRANRELDAPDSHQLNQISTLILL